MKQRTTRTSAESFAHTTPKTDARSQTGSHQTRKPRLLPRQSTRSLRLVAATGRPPRVVAAVEEVVVVAAR